MAQNGRSMVEMLGVLAIIGVLSIGGIAGYRIAMDHHRSNETLDTVNKAAVLVSSALISGTIDPAKDEGIDLDITETPFGNALTAKMDEGNRFIITVDDLNSRDCRGLVRQWPGEGGLFAMELEGTGLITAANSKDLDTVCTESSQYIDFIFNKDYSTNVDNSGDDSNEDYTTINPKETEASSLANGNLTGSLSIVKTTAPAVAPTTAAVVTSVGISTVGVTTAPNMSSNLTTKAPTMTSPIMTTTTKAPTITSPIITTTTKAPTLTAMVTTKVVQPIVSSAPTTTTKVTTLPTTKATTLTTSKVTTQMPKTTAVAVNTVPVTQKITPAQTVTITAQ